MHTKTLTMLCACVRVHVRASASSRLDVHPCVWPKPIRTPTSIIDGRISRLLLSDCFTEGDNLLF